jgi:hypothetical protein
MSNFSPLSKVWIYQSDRFFTEEELDYLTKKSSDFITAWTAHGKLLKAELKIYYKLFLVLFVDETEANASGCGIDKSVHFFQQMEKDLKVNLMNRMLVAYKENELVKICSLNDFEKKLASNEVNSETVVFNNLINNKAEFDAAWEIPLKKSWHSKMLIAK